MSVKVSVTLPDDVYLAAREYGAQHSRTVANLCTFAMRLYMSKYAPKHAPKPIVPSDRNGARAGAKPESGSKDGATC